MKSQIKFMFLRGIAFLTIMENGSCTKSEVIEQTVEANPEHSISEVTEWIDNLIDSSLIYVNKREEVRLTLKGKQDLVNELMNYVTPLLINIAEEQGSNIIVGKSGNSDSSTQTRFNFDPSDN